MKQSITKIEVQKKNKDRVNIYINNDYAFSCGAELIYRHQLKVGKAIEINDLKTIVEEENFLSCKNSALKTIERSYKTEKEIFEKLLGKGYEEKIIARTMEFLKSYNFVDDSRYAEAYIKEKIRNQGKNKIKYALLRKGIPEELVIEKLSRVSNEFEREAALGLAEKKYNILLKSEQDYGKIYKKLGDYLLRIGYDVDNIKDILKKVVKEGEEKVSPKEPDVEKLKELAEKRYNILKKSENDGRKLYKKLGEYLVRKGYSYDEVKKILKEIME